MIKPFLQDEAFLEDVRSAQPGQLHLWWLGQSGFLVKWGASHLLIDPYLSDSLTNKYAGTDKPHVRMTERVVAPEKLDFIDVVTSSHNHTDHLDRETLGPLLQANPKLKVIVPQANLDFAANRLQMPPNRLTPIRTDSDPIQVGPFTFYAIPSAHEVLEQDNNGDHKFVGYLIKVGGKIIYHSGDACPYEGLISKLSQWPIDIAIIPINGRDPARRVPGNFTADEAAALGKAIRTGLIIPCHYDMFEFNTVSPEGFIHYAKLAGIPFNVMRNGERFSI